MIFNSKLNDIRLICEMLELYMNNMRLMLDVCGLWRQEGLSDTAAAGFVSMLVEKWTKKE